MKKRIISIIFILLLFPVAGVFAFTYFAPISVVETDSITYDQIAVTANSDTTYLAAQGYIDVTGLDTRVLDGSITLPHMLASDRVLFSLELDADETKLLRYEWGNSLLSNFAVITGRDSYITIADSSDIEVGTRWRFDIEGYFDTTAGSSRDVLFKTGTFQLYIVAEGVLSAVVNPGGVMTSANTSLSSGIYTISVVVDTTDLKLFVDTIEVASTTLNASPVNNSNDWILVRNNVLSYMEYVTISK